MIIPNIVIDIPLSLVQLLVIIFIMVPTICVVTTLESHRFATRHHRKWVKEQKAEIARENQALNERRAVQRNADNDLRIQRQALAEAKREFREAAGKLETEGKNFDTLVSVLDLDEIPHPSDTADTVEFPAIEEDWR
jgi:hypothetical protein